MTAAIQIAPGATGALRALTEALGGQRVLLVLDNFEQLAGLAEDLVEQLAIGLPTLHLLVTSRRPLGLDGEHEFGVATVELPAADAGLDAAAGNAAVELFVERARCARRLPSERAQRADARRAGARAGGHAAGDRTRGVASAQHRAG